MDETKVYTYSCNPYPSYGQLQNKKHLLKMSPSNQQLGHKNQDQSTFVPKTAIALNLLQENQWNLSRSKSEPSAAKYPLFDHKLVHYPSSKYHEGY